MEMKAADLKNTFKKLLKGDKRSLSRLITLVENESSAIEELFGDIHRHSGRAYRVGITGPPGAGKSTMVNSLAMEIKKTGRKAAIIAVDPTSPFTGGALLGDRIRMSCALTDPDLFMRSMASRGGTGGLARTTPQVADLLDAFGFDVIIIETVGVGQLELEVAGSVDTTVVVLVPETGGNVQAMKAGLIEIADIFAINKSDRQGADIIKQELLDAMNLLPDIEEARWKVPIVKTVAVKGEGISQLMETVFNHMDYQIKYNLLAANRIEQKKKKIISILKHKLEVELWGNPEFAPFIDKLSKMCADNKIDPYAAADVFLQRAKVRTEKIKESFVYC